MTSRQIVLDTLEHNCPSRVPWQMWTLPWAERTYPREMGYDTVSFEDCITSVLPGGALGDHKKGVIQSWEDFEEYPWDQVEDNYFANFGSGNSIPDYVPVDQYLHMVTLSAACGERTLKTNRR